ncbi:Ulp1 protease family protein [Abeliophyllum distichum]|uniref:Ulp1 protease family protein n=1 Tax=Abeliophyllum distichum TaxID=126358 RepID=A0ABD1P5B7_9LAMI
MEKDSKRNEGVTKTSEQLDVETEKMTNEEPAMETDGVTDRMITGGQQPAGEAEQLLMEFAMGSQHRKVEAQIVTEKVVTTDVPAVFFTRKKRKKKEIVKSKELAGKKLKVPSAHLSSPLTTTTNRRNFIDGSKIDLFHKVDPVKETEFLKWYSKLGTGVAYELGSVRLTDTKEWFNDVLTDGKWLADEHIDMAMYLLRQRATMYPKSFGNKRVIMDFAFKNILEIAQMITDSCPNNLTIPDYLFDYVHGKSPSNGQRWEGCTHLYIPVLANSHWFAAEINFAESTVYVYDP